MKTKSEACKQFLRGHASIGDIFDAGVDSCRAELEQLSKEHEALLAYLDETDPKSLATFRIFRARNKTE